MNAAELLSQVNASGASLYIDSKGRLRGKGDIVPFRSQIAENKPALVALLMQQTGTLFDIAPEPVHHPTQVCPMCGGPLLLEETDRSIFLDCLKEHWVSIEPKGWQG